MIPTVQVIMDTTMLPQTKSNFRKAYISVAVIALLSVNGASAADLKINADVAASVIQQETSRPNGNSDGTTIEIEPTVNAQLSSRTVQAKWAGSYTYLNRDVNDTSRSDRFNSYNYDLTWAPLEELLVLSAKGAMRYQNVNVNGNLVNDFLLNDDELSKTRSNRYAAQLNLNDNGYFESTGTAFYTDTNSERSANQNQNQNSLNNDSYGLRGSIQSSENAKKFIWGSKGQFINTERSGNL